ncbi:GNAT family N-acetyltransferase [Streptomyces spiramenti]|uniref:GNAT family N-acetyltransferase n=1 Tax=Streptomyces spiramenti TaxID=2720606 RepID=A0ABX1AQJ5_9ACTN|nr:GNAT family protein [Streptomyces spiramenti]NJP67693.1 GNAT family N-acetyltransferase [Streptomyces spiramenti]
MTEVTGPIRTERLVLRPFTLDDAADTLAFESREDVVRYVPYGVRDAEENARQVARRAEQTSLRERDDALVLAVDLDGTVIGYVLLILRDAEHRLGEIGWILHPDHTGRGYATEAARALLRIAFEEADLHRVFARCDARNTASPPVMTRLGMRREAVFVEAVPFKGEWTTELRYAILAREWRAAAEGPAVRAD